VCDREVVTEHFTDAAVNQPAVRAVLERVTMAVDEEINREWQMGTPRGARCTITLRDGRRVATRVDWPTGSIRRPLSPEQLRRKYLDCVSGIVTDEAASESLTRLEALQAVTDIREITGPLTDIAG
jgi:2-methylcitrate dehydratase PrpD